MRTTLKFKTTEATDWLMVREFKDEGHMNNFIDYICRTKGYTLDEVYRD